MVNQIAKFDKLGRAAQGNNWGGGGPGGFPIPPLNTISNLDMDDSSADFYFHLPQPDANSQWFQSGSPTLDDLRSSDGGAHVAVCILDTAPDLSSTTWDQYWIDKVIQFPENPLVKSLNHLRENGNFEMINALDSLWENKIHKTLAKAGLESYRVPDHGIFVAGIIHSIAPQAKIYLIRVLDEWGIGALNPVQDGYMMASYCTAADGTWEKPQIINCSLNVVLTVEEANRNRGDQEAMWGDLTEAQMVAVAAAGNDGNLPTHYATPYPFPRFPAGFETVLGVSSSSKIVTGNGMRTSYANWADDFSLPPDANGLNIPRRGIITNGGNLISVGNDRITDPNDSILGLYLDDFPQNISATRWEEFPPPGGPMVQAIDFNRFENKQGWAKWSGTSFASAITSGVLALLGSHLYTTAINNSSAPPDRESIIGALLDYCGHNNLFEFKEHILKVTQGS